MYRFVSLALYAFKCDSRLIAPTRKIMISRSWMSPNLRELKWLAFSVTTGSMYRSLMNIGSKLDLIKLMPCFALLNSKTGNVIQKRSNCSCRSISWFSCKWRMWVEAKLSWQFSSCHTTSASVTCPRRQCRWLGCSIILFSLFLKAVSLSRNKVLFCTLLWETTVSRVAKRDAATCWGSALNREIGCSTRFGDMEAEMENGFPNCFVFWSSPLAHNIIQNQLQLNSWKDPARLCNQFQKSSACQKECLVFHDRSLDKRV